MDVDLHAANKPDASDVDRTALDVRPTPAKLRDATDAFDVVIPSAAWAKMQTHARTRLDVEVGGVLIGKVVASNDGVAYLHIEAGIPALAAESRETNITFTAEAWTHIHKIIDRDHPGAAIVGWYHTHPSFGIFLSEMDVFIQRHFFDLPHQIAIVIDPVAKTDGCFVWRSGVPTLGTLIIEPATRAALAEPEPTVSVLAKPAPTKAKIVEKSFRDRHVVGPSLRQRIVAFLDPLLQLDLSQWIALIVLLLLTATLFGALALLWLDTSVMEVWHGTKSLWLRMSAR